MGGFHALLDRSHPLYKMVVFFHLSLKLLNAIAYKPI